MDKYELQKLRDLPIEEVAERLGITVKHHKALCPFHDDKHPSLSFKVSKNTYRCFVCGASGGTIDLVMRHLNKDFREACRWLQTLPLQTLPLAPPCMEGSDYSCNGIYSPPYRERLRVGELCSGMGQGGGSSSSVCLKYRQQNRGTYNETK